MARDVAPYPYDRWPRLSRREASLRRLAARRSPLAELARAESAARPVLGAPLRIVPGAPTRAPWPIEPEPIIAALLIGERPELRAALVLDPALASVLVDRALGGDGTLSRAMGPFDELERGALAYALARWLASSRAFRVAAILTSAAALRATLPGEPICWPMQIEIGAHRGHAALFTSPDAATSRALATLQPLAKLLLDVAIVAGRAELARRILESLGPGDVVVLDEHAIEVSGRVRGEVSVRIAGSTGYRLRCRWEGSDALEVLGRDDDAALPRARATKENGVDDRKEQELLQAAGDAPVEIAVELARFELPLEELASLAPGEVIVTGVPVGERVTLRAGRHAVALGELVDVDGEVGVRVLELIPRYSVSVTARSPTSSRPTRTRSSPPGR